MRTAIAVLAIALLLATGGGLTAGYFLWWSGDNDGVEPAEVTLSETAKVLDDASLKLLSSVSEDGSILTFDDATEQLESLSEGDVIVCGLSDATPYGLLRKVEEVNRDGDKVIAETSQATLEDAIEEGTIEFNWSLTSTDGEPSAESAQGTGSTFQVTPADMGSATRYGSAETKGTSWSSDDKVLVTPARDVSLAEDTSFRRDIDVIVYDEDEDPETTEDQIRATGYLDLRLDFDFAATIEWFKIKELHCEFTSIESAELEISGNLTHDIHEENEVGKITLPPVLIPSTPFFFTPVIAINVGVDGKVTAGLTTGVKQSSTATVGVEYQNGEWTTVKDLEKDLEWKETSLTTSCQVEAYARAEFSFMLCGMAGPYGGVEGYLELDADSSRTPWWELYGGIRGDVGLRADVFGLKLEYGPAEVIHYRNLLDQAPESPDESSSPDDQQTEPSLFYDVQAAVDYAETWWDDRNTGEYEAYDADCASFVSQCLIAGGLDLTNGTRPNPSTALPNTYGVDESGCIINCDDLHAYLVNYLGAQYERRPRGEPEPEWFLPGDVAIFGNDSDPWTHAVFAVSGDATHYAECNAHSEDTQHTTIQQFFNANDDFTLCNYYHIPTGSPAPTSYSLTTAVTPSGAGTVSPMSGQYAAGASVPIAADHATGYEFVNWTGDVGTVADVNAQDTTITMNGNYSITANFSPISDTYQLSIDSTSGGSVTQPREGTFTYSSGDVVTLAAAPQSGYEFVNWSGDVSTVADVNAADTAITMNSDYSVTANFTGEVVTFPDPNLEAAIRDALGQPTRP